MTIGVSFFGSTATAQEDTQARFERLLQEGTVFFDATDYERALDRFVQARAIYDHPRLRITIGKTYENLNQCGVAKKMYRSVSDDTEAQQFERERASARLKVIDTECVERVERVAEPAPEPDPDPVEQPDPGLSTTTQSKSSNALPIVGGVLVGVGAVGLIVGGVATVIDRSNIDDVWTRFAEQNGCRYDTETDAITQCPEAGLEQTEGYRQITDEVKKSNSQRTIIFIGSGVVLTAGVGVLIYHVLRPPKSEVSITPVVGRRQVGASVELRF